MKYCSIQISFFFIVLATAAGLFSAGCGTASETIHGKAFSSLIDSIDKKFDDPRFSNAFWGVEIKSLRTGKIWYERNSNKMFMPASNEKLPTAASAFMLLGPDFKFRTDLYASGEVKDSVLNGNIMVVGDGDPTLYTRFYSDPRDVFYAWADSLKKMGIKKITGNIIGDGRAFGDDSLGFGWSYDGLDAWYSAEVSALQLNENYVDIKITPPQYIGGKVIIEPDLPSKFYSIKDDITVLDTGRARLFVRRQCGTNNIIISGTVKAGGRPVMESPSITNPVLFYVTVLREVLMQSGIEVDGEPVNAAQTVDNNSFANNSNLLITHYSAPLKDIIKVMLKRSQNLYAETLARAIGLKESGKGTFSAGKK